MSDLLQRIEKHAQPSTPPEKEILLDGWRLRSTGGRTRRFNSVNFRGDASEQLSLEEKLSQTENFYHVRSQLPLFRITPLAAPADLPAQLSLRGYVSADETDVLAKEIMPGRYEATAPEIEITSVLSAKWLAALARLTGKNEDQLQSFEDMLARLEIQPIFAAYRSADEITSIGFATVDDGIMGLFEFATAENFRRRGQAEAVVTALLSDAAARNVDTAYLQVVCANEAGQAFWRHIGFNQHICTYYYMHRPVV